MEDNGVVADKLNFTETVKSEGETPEHEGSGCKRKVYDLEEEAADDAMYGHVQIAEPVSRRCLGCIAGNYV
jgi:hypothetical protein